MISERPWDGTGCARARHRVQMSVARPILTPVAYSHIPPVERHRVPKSPIYYSCLKETKRIRDIRDPSGGTLAAIPATVRIHAVDVADDQIACSYTRKAEDITVPGRDWFTVQSGEMPCEDCRDEIQPAWRRTAQ